MLRKQPKNLMIMEITIKISKPDFDLAIPAAKESKGTVFAKLEKKINAAIVDIGEDILGDVGIRYVNGNPESVAAWAVKVLASVDVFLREMRGLDLVLTETGFGVVSTNNTAPASKMRVDALDGELRVKWLRAVLQDGWLVPAGAGGHRYPFLLLRVPETVRRLPGSHLEGLGDSHGHHPRYGQVATG